MRFFAVFLLAFVLFALPKTVYADETSITASPAIIDVPAKVGESSKREIKITNNNDYPLPVSIEAQAAIIDGEPLNDGVNSRYDVSDWIRFDEDTYLFEAGQTRSIPFTVTPPFTATAGGHYANISIRGLALESNFDELGLVFPEIGVPVLVSLPGEVVEKIEFSNNNLFPISTQPNKKYLFETKLSNVGTVHNLVQPKIVIEKEGQLVDEFLFRPSVILPGTQKVFSTEWSVPDFGIYNAHVELVYGSKNQKISSNSEVVVSTPNLKSLANVFVMTGVVVYLIPRRKNIKPAVKKVFTNT